MGFLERILARTASDTINKVGARLIRDQKKHQEGFEAGYKQGYADAKAGKKPKVK